MDIVIGAVETIPFCKTTFQDFTFKMRISFASEAWTLLVIMSMEWNRYWFKWIEWGKSWEFHLTLSDPNGGGHFCHTNFLQMFSEISILHKKFS